MGEGSLIGPTQRLFDILNISQGIYFYHLNVLPDHVLFEAVMKLCKRFFLRQNKTFGQGLKENSKSEYEKELPFPGGNGQSLLREILSFGGFLHGVSLLGDEFKEKN